MAEGIKLCGVVVENMVGGTCRTERLSHRLESDKATYLASECTHDSIHMLVCPELAFGTCVPGVSVRFCPCLGRACLLKQENLASDPTRALRLAGAPCVGQTHGLLRHNVDDP